MELPSHLHSRRGLCPDIHMLCFVLSYFIFPRGITPHSLVEWMVTSKFPLYRGQSSVAWWSTQGSCVTPGSAFPAGFARGSPARCFFLFNQRLLLVSRFLSPVGPAGGGAGPLGLRTPPRLCSRGQRQVPCLLGPSEGAGFGNGRGSPFGVKIGFPLGKRLLPDC